MRTPAGTECQYFYGDYRRGRNHEECRLLDEAVPRQQWTPDLAGELAYVESVLFLDCAIDIPSGAVRVVRVQPSPAQPGLATHHVGAAELLALSEELYSSVPCDALLLTVGAGSMELGETFSPSVHAALPEACKLLEDTVCGLIHLNAHNRKA